MEDRYNTIDNKGFDVVERVPEVPVTMGLLVIVLVRLKMSRLIYSTYKAVVCYSNSHKELSVYRTCSVHVVIRATTVRSCVTRLNFEPMLKWCS